MMFHIPGLTISALLIAMLSLFSSLAIGADNYPSRPIKLMVGALPGGTTDTMARVIVLPLALSLGRPVLVENRPVPVATLAGGCGRQVGARRLYPANQLHQPYDQRDPLSQAAVRSGDGLQADQHDRDGAEPAGRNPALPAQDLCCADRARQGQAGYLEYRHRRHRLIAAPRRRATQADGRSTHPERAVQGNRARVDGCARRPS